MGSVKIKAEEKFVPLPANDNEPRTSIDADSLLDMEFSPVKYIVPGFIAEGLTILAGKPKLGKSWLALGFCIAVASGTPTLGAECEQGDVCYFALEDNRRRLQDRLKLILPKMKSLRPSLARLDLEVEAPLIGAGLIEKLTAWKDRVENPRLIIIDTLAKVRPPVKGNQGAYASDYEAISPLQKFAMEHRIGVVVVTHVRKAEAEDPLEMISGTNGITGAADSTLVLTRDGNGSKLYGRGRDVEEVEKALRFEAGKWHAIGDVAEAGRSDERRTLMALAAADGTISPKDLAASTGLKPANVRFLLGKMVAAGEAEKSKFGLYKAIS